MNILAYFFLGCTVIQNMCISACHIDDTTVSNPVFAYSLADPGAVPTTAGWRCDPATPAEDQGSCCSSCLFQLFKSMWHYTIANFAIANCLFERFLKKMSIYFVYYILLPLLCLSRFYKYCKRLHLPFWCVSPKALQLQKAFVFLFFACVSQMVSVLSLYFQMKDLKIQKTVENFHSFVHTLLSEPAERELFFKVRIFFLPCCRRIFNLVILLSFDFGMAVKTFFCVAGGVSGGVWSQVWPGAREAAVGVSAPTGQAASCSKPCSGSLTRWWNEKDATGQFAIKFKVLFCTSPSQTVSWLSDTPPVLEECARSATQPQLLKVLLQHQTCLGHLETPGGVRPSWTANIVPLGCCCGFLILFCSSQHLSPRAWETPSWTHCLCHPLEKWLPIRRGEAWSIPQTHQPTRSTDYLLSHQFLEPYLIRMCPLCPLNLKRRQRLTHCALLLNACQTSVKSQFWDALQKHSVGSNAGSRTSATQRSLNKYLT